MLKCMLDACVMVSFGAPTFPTLFASHSMYDFSITSTFADFEAKNFV